jgi:hypothetical protein
LPIPGNLLTTAMAVMPHTDVAAALDAALSLDIPFWPQLPRLNYCEDMYVQASEHFPGIVLDMDKQTLAFSMDVYLNAEIFATYADSIKRFVDRGGVIVWGIVPTNVEPFEAETDDTLAKRLEHIWGVLEKKGIEKEHLLARSLISPATCCLVNPDGEKTVEKAFGVVQNLSRRLRRKYFLT